MFLYLHYIILNLKIQGKNKFCFFLTIEYNEKARQLSLTLEKLFLYSLLIEAIYIEDFYQNLRGKSPFFLNFSKKLEILKINFFLILKSPNLIFIIIYFYFLFFFSSFFLVSFKFMSVRATKTPKKLEETFLSIK